MKRVDNYLFEHYESIFMGAPDLYLLLKPDRPGFTIVVANDAFAEATRTNRGDLLGKHFFEALPYTEHNSLPEGKETMRASLEHVLKHGQPHRIEVQRFDLPAPPERGGGMEVSYWMALNTPVFDAQGEIAYIIHRAENITRRLRNERDRKRFSDVTSDILGKAGFDGYFKEINSSCEDILGWTPAEMCSRPLIDFVHPDDVDLSPFTLDGIRSGKGCRQFENRYRCRDSSYRWLSWNTLSFIEEGLIYCAATDITPSRRLREVSEGQKQALEQSVRGAPLPDILELLTRTLENNARLGVRASILLVSKDREHLLTGAAPSLPESYRDAVTAIKLGEGQGSCGTVVSSGKMHLAHDTATDPDWAEYRQLAADHQLRACWSTPILSSSGDVFGSFVLYYDAPTDPSDEERQLVEILSRTAGIVIEREQNQAARRVFQHDLIQARNEAEAANVAKSEFLANMSHEIRTPMNVVLGITDILLHHESLTEPQADLLHTLQHSADSLLELINNLLDISRIEARRFELKRVPFNLSRLLGEIGDMMTIRARQKGLAFSATGHELCHEVLVGDPTRLRQVILNLCSNALKFTQAGKVSILLDCDYSAGHDRVDVSINVTDTGIGIETDKLDVIFEKFTQADNSISRKFGGTGLGLSITKQLVGEMNGTITVTSSPGVGSTFTVTLPLTISSRPAPDPDKPARVPSLPLPGSGAGGNILLVEDFEPNAVIAGRYLKLFGYRYEVATNGLEAIDLATKGQYDLILMDVQMPELDGFEATRRIREYEQASGARPIPIVAMTAHAMAGDRERCLAAGMDDYLPKPFNALELKEKLRELVSGFA